MDKTAEQVAALVKQLRKQAREYSEASRMMAEAKSLRQADNPEQRTDLYAFQSPEGTIQWKAADLIEQQAAQIAALSARPASNYVMVREIETVTGDFCTEPGEPFYRIEIDGFCADFDYREAADNFAAAINARIAARPAVAEDVVERVRLVVMQELWKREQYNGVTADYNAFRDTMAGRIEKYEAEAERIARAAIAAITGEGE